MHQPCTFSLIALKIRITVSAVEKTLFLRWTRKLSVLLTGCLWPVWNGSMGFTLKEMSSILMLSGFSLKWKRHWSLLLTFTCLFRLWSFSLFSSHSYPFFFFFGRPSLLFLSLSVSAIGGLLKLCLRRVWRLQQLSQIWAQPSPGSSRMSGESDGEMSANHIL